MMNTEKQLQKLLKTFVKANACDNRKQAQKLIHKADKITKKLNDV
jgi:hypothetical protein